MAVVEADFAWQYWYGFRRSRLYFLNGTGNVPAAAGPAARYVHVPICLNAASMRHLPWVFGVPLRKCKPLSYGSHTNTAKQNLIEGQKQVVIRFRTEL